MISSGGRRSAASPSSGSVPWSKEKMKYDLGLTSPDSLSLSADGSKATPPRSRSSLKTASRGTCGNRSIRSSTSAVRLPIPTLLPAQAFSSSRYAPACASAVPGPPAARDVSWYGDVRRQLGVGHGGTPGRRQRQGSGPQTQLGVGSVAVVGRAGADLDRGLFEGQ